MIPRSRVKTGLPMYSLGPAHSRYQLLTEPLLLVSDRERGPPPYLGSQGISSILPSPCSPPPSSDESNRADRTAKLLGSESPSTNSDAFCPVLIDVRSAEWPFLIADLSVRLQFLSSRCPE